MLVCFEQLHAAMHNEYLSAPLIYILHIHSVYNCICVCIGAYLSINVHAAVQSKLGSVFILTLS